MYLCSLVVNHTKQTYKSLKQIIHMNKTFLIPSFEGLVVEGKKMGRTLGFPTANLEVKNINLFNQLEGVYAVWVEVDNTKYKGMLNIGKRPSFEKFPPSIEVHILDFKQNIYGKKIKIILVNKLRNEKKFPSKEALIEQLNLDKKNLLSQDMKV